MEAITTIGLDIAKSVFQVHGVDAAGNVIVRRQLKRRYVVAFFQKVPPCLVGIEACATWHHWSREIAGSWPYRAADAAGAQLRMLKAQILGLDRRIMAWHRPNGTSQRLDQIPGVGPALATALVASVPDPKVPFVQGDTSLPGSGSCPGNTRAKAFLTL